MVYVQDTDAIRDAKDEVDDIKLEIQIHEIDKQIDAINEQIESLEKYYDDLIESTERMYNAQIEVLQGIKDQWESIAEMADMQKALGLLEMYGLTVEDVLSGNSDALDKFKSRYLDVANAINNYEMTGAVDGLVSGFDEATSSATKLSDAINGTGSSGGTTTGSTDGEKSSDSSGTSLKSAIDEQTEDAKEKINEQIALLSGEEESLKDSVQQVIDKLGVMDDEGNADPNTLLGAVMAQYEQASVVLPEEKSLFDTLADSIANCVAQLQLMIQLLEEADSGSNFHASDGGNIHGGGGSARAKGTVGNAFASGYNGLPSAEKNALRSEYGQPELTVYPDGHYEITTTPTMSDLPKDTVIFNDEQTKRIMNGKSTISGKSYSNGNVVNKFSGLFRELQPGDQGYELNQLAKQLKNKMIDFGEVMPRIADIDKNVDSITKNINSINNNSMRQIYNTIENVNVTCPGITSDDVAKQIGSALRKEFSGMSLNAYQKMNATR